MQATNIISPLEEIHGHPGTGRGIRLLIKRDDLIHPVIQGNKWRKLRPLLENFHQRGYAGILSFGGPFSNHLHALAAAGSLYGIPTAGIVRGEYADWDNPTLAFARSQGMELQRISKKSYDAIKAAGFVIEGARWKNYCILPEGGSTIEAMRSCMDISREIVQQLGEAGISGNLYIAVAAGTGTTAAGIMAGLTPDAGHTLVFPAARYGVGEQEIRELLEQAGMTSSGCHFSIYYDENLGKFAAFHPAVLELAQQFRDANDILLDPLYTGRMLHGLYTLLAAGDIPSGSCVVAVHTGGLQGWKSGS